MATGGEEGLGGPRSVWATLPSRKVADPYGYGRIPAFWYTLNLPFNYLFEIHRFEQAATECSGQQAGPCPGEARLDPRSVAAQTARCTWVLDNPDLVVIVHAIRVEVLLRNVLAHVVRQDPLAPFQYWCRFEWGTAGNPHVHGQSWAPDNPDLEFVLKDEATREALLKDNPEAAKWRTWAEAELEVASFFDPYVREMHPAKDQQGEPHYDFLIEMLGSKHGGKPQTVSLLDLLEDAFSTDEPGLSALKELLLALIESGQRHTAHGQDPPVLKVHPCARKGATSESSPPKAPPELSRLGRRFQCLR